LTNDFLWEKGSLGSERNHLGRQLFTNHWRPEVKSGVEKLNKKILLGILCVAVIAIAGTAAFADTWLSQFNNIYIKTGTTQEIKLFDDCDAKYEVQPWTQAVEQGGVYEFALYVLNTGTKQVYITYLPTDFSSDAGQTRMHITVQVIGFGMPCQMIANNIPLPTGVASLPYNLPEKSIGNPTAGFPLAPNKMIKLDVTVRVDSLDLNHVPSTLGTWTIPFEVVSVSV
jgi:hypothetical protein